MNKQTMRRTAGVLAALSGVMLLASGFLLQRVDVMIVGLAALVVVLAGLTVGLRFRVAALSGHVQQLPATFDGQVGRQLGDFRRASNETNGLVLRSFRDMETAHRVHAADLREAKDAIAVLSKSLEEVGTGLGSLNDESARIRSALGDVADGVEAASGRMADALAGIPVQLADVVQAKLSPSVENSQRLARELIRQTEGLPTNVVSAVQAALVPDLETSAKLMRQLIRQGDALPPKVTSVLRAEMAADMETSARLMRQLIRQTDGLPPKIAEALQAAIAPSSEVTEKLMRQIVRNVGGLPSEFATQIESFAQSTDKLNALAYRALAKIQHETLQEAEAVVQLYRLFDLQAPMPLLGGAAKGWAMEPITMLAVVREVLSRKPGLVVECGSGTSTVWIAHALSRIGAGSLISLEHLEHYAALGEAALAAHGLGQVAEIRRAPLETCRLGDETFNWYKGSSLADVKDVAMLIVDGPPNSTGPLARYPAFPVLCDRLTSGALVLVDDVGRDDEKLIVERWRREYSALLNPRMISNRTMAFDYSP